MWLYWDFAQTIVITLSCDFFFRMKVKGRRITCLLVPFAVMCLVVTPGGRACPRRCACYVPTEVHCTFRYLTSIPNSIPPNVERINLGCVGALILPPSQEGIVP